MPADLAAGRSGSWSASPGRSRREPRLLCLDEPAAGLDTHESEELGRRLEEVAHAGQAMLLVDHDMGLVLCDLATTWSCSSSGR